jgi:glycosyltransferase 2 family protein
VHTCRHQPDPRLRFARRRVVISFGNRRTGLAVIITLVVAAAVYGVFRLLGAGFDLARFLTSFRQMHYGWLAAGATLVLLTYAGRAFRWRVLIAPLRPHASLSGLLKATVIGFTAVALFGRPGELVRPYLIAVREKLSLSSQLAAWIVERIYDLLFVLLIFGFGLTRVNPREGMSSALVWVLQTGGYFVAGLGLLCVTLLIAISVFTEPATRRIREALGIVPASYRDRVDRLITAFAGGMASSGRGIYVIQLVAYTIAEWVVIIGANYCLLQAFPATRQLTLIDNVVFLGFIAFGSVVQVPGIGGGMQVAAVLVLTELFGVSLEPATAAALLLWITMYIVVIPIGLLLAVHQGLSWRSLRHIDPGRDTSTYDVSSR